MHMQIGTAAALITIVGAAVTGGVHYFDLLERLEVLEAQVQEHKEEKAAAAKADAFDANEARRHIEWAVNPNSGATYSDLNKVLDGDTPNMYAALIWATRRNPEGPRTICSITPTEALDFAAEGKRKVGGYDLHCFRRSAISGTFATFKRESITGSFCRNGIPPLNWSTVMIRKRRTRDGEQTAQAGRDCSEITAG